MTLIQDGNQIESKMVQTGILDTFIPLDWATANGTTPEEYEGYLPLQTLNKVFMYNNTGDKAFNNVWDFVAEDAHGLFMDIDSELVGKNFLYMLTEETYATMLKDAFDALSADEQAYFQPTIDEMESEASDLGLGENGKYALAWIKLWVGSYNAQTDDGPHLQHPRRRLRDRPVRPHSLLQAPQRRGERHRLQEQHHRRRLQRRLHRHRRLWLLPLPVRHREQPAALDRLRLHRLHDLHGRRLLRLGQGHRRLLLQPRGRR